MGISQKTMAEWLSIDPRTYQYYEAGREPDLETLRNIAKIFGITMAELLGEQIVPHETNEEFRQGLDPAMRYTPITASDRTLELKETSEADRLLAEKERTIKRLEADWAWLKVQFEKLVGANNQQKG